MVELMCEAKSAGRDPYEVLAWAALFGYSSEDLIAVGNAYEYNSAVSEPDVTQEDIDNLIAGVEQYLQDL